MKWRKLCRLFCPAGQRSWMQSHAAMAMPLSLGDSLYRVYFGTRDADNRPHIGYVDFDINQPSQILQISENHVMGPGPWGYFDDNGVYPGGIVREGDRLLMYYSGRSNGVSGLYYMSIGLAESIDGGLTFQRLLKAPVMGRGEHDPGMVSTPWVIKDETKWRLWYMSGMGWKSIGENGKSLYDIKYAESDDGINWNREGWTAIGLSDVETNVAAPTVIKLEQGYKMWYSYVVEGREYRLGFADSEDGYEWTRRDNEIGIDLSTDGWDSESMAYPCVFVHQDHFFLLYSGNANGRDGIGIAIAEG